MARQGGVHSARPKAVLDALQPLFPELGLQVQNIKWWVPAATMSCRLPPACKQGQCRGLFAPGSLVPVGNSGPRLPWLPPPLVQAPAGAPQAG